jgi:hypothetical protein
VEINKEGKMIGLSELAARALVESLEASGVEPEKGLRLKPKGKRYALQLDIPGENDRVIRHKGAIALIVDKDVEAKVGDATIDIEEGSKEPYLALLRNKVK